MARLMAPEREKEFAELLAFVEFYCEQLRPELMPHKTQGSLSLRGEAQRIAQEYRRSKALVGTRQAANDIIEDLSRLRPEGVSFVDEALRQAGIITLSEVRRRYSSQFQRILRRGAIKSETEYYLINGLVCDQSSSLTENERNALAQMLSEFEV